MAHHSATIKAVRQTKIRNERNTALRTKLRNSVKKVVAAIDSGNKDEAKNALLNAQKQIDKSVTKGVLKKETGSRKLSRLNKSVKEIAK